MSTSIMPDQSNYHSILAQSKPRLSSLETKYYAQSAEQVVKFYATSTQPAIPATTKAVAGVEVVIPVVAPMVLKYQWYSDR